MFFVLFMSCVLLQAATGQTKDFTMSLNDWARYKEDPIGDDAKPTIVLLKDALSRYEEDPSHPQVLLNIYNMLRTQDTPEVWEVQPNMFKIQALKKFLSVRDQKPGKGEKALIKHKKKVAQAAASLMKTILDLWGDYLLRHMSEFEVLDRQPVFVAVEKVCGKKFLHAGYRGSWGKMLTDAYAAKYDVAALVKIMANEALRGTSLGSIKYSLYQYQKGGGKDLSKAPVGNSYYKLKPRSLLRERLVNQDSSKVLHAFEQQMQARNNTAH